MIRKSVDLTSDQMEKLGIIAENRGRVAIASLLRLAVIEFLDQNSPGEDDSYKEKAREVQE